MVESMASGSRDATVLANSDPASSLVDGFLERAAEQGLSGVGFYHAPRIHFEKSLVCYL
jgi:hypothetical protein